MKLTYDNAGVPQGTITGYLKTVGFQDETTFVMDAKGRFRIEFQAKGDQQYMLFNEAPAEGYLAVDSGSGKLGDSFRKNLEVSAIFMGCIISSHLEKYYNIFNHLNILFTG